MQAPWWTTIAAAMAGGVIALLATFLTSIVTAVISGRRQRLDLAHARSLEREKLLYPYRLPLYLEVQELISAIDGRLTELRHFCKHNLFEKDGRSTRIQALKSELDLLNGKKNAIIVVSDLELTTTFAEFCLGMASEISSIEAGNLEADLELSPPDSSGKREFVPKRANLYDNIIDAIRREIGSGTDELDGRQLLFRINEPDR